MVEIGKTASETRTAHTHRVQYSLEYILTSDDDAAIVAAALLAKCLLLMIMKCNKIPIPIVRRCFQFSHEKKRKNHAMWSLYNFQDEEGNCDVK